MFYWDLRKQQSLKGRISFIKVMEENNPNEEQVHSQEDNSASNGEYQASPSLPVSTEKVENKEDLKVPGEPNQGQEVAPQQVNNTPSFD